YDNMQVGYANDVLQEETLLRSERMRTGIQMQDSPQNFPMSGYMTEVSSNDHVTTYKIINQSIKSNGREKIGPTLIKAYRGRKSQFGNDDDKMSPIIRYAESILQGRSLAQYQYFTMHEYSENDEYMETDRVKFWGPDVLWGPVHSNDDIWIQQLGGGTNNNWPTFHALVTTNGRIMDHATGQPAVQTAPMDLIFLDGYQENSGFINISAGNAIEIRNNGYNLDTSEGRDILYVKLDGTNAICRYADIITEPDTFTVYNSFPDPAHPTFPVGDSIWTNYVNVKRVDWDDMTFNLSVLNSSVFVHCKMWIEGSMSGRQTWGCADTIFITGDLVYNGTNPGDPPSLTDPDILGIVSEERIYIQYKNYDPDTEQIQSPNTNGLFLYGCYAAIGDGNMDLYGDLNTHYEGIFSFYYMHPHGSTPGFTITYPNGYEWDIEFPDFHKFIFPLSPYWSGDPGFLLHGGPIAANPWPTCGYPYENPAYPAANVPPYGTDWPWYNPVWPEAVNTQMGERGIIHMFGGIQQFRRGFVHRSGSDPLNHPGNGWDIDHWEYDGTHDSTGYDKDYHWDDRIDYGMLPPNYPQVYEGMGSTTLYYSSSGWTMKVPPRY
ncbi:MAG: hypothetical protein K9N06_11135, partial [Candidatus Cloacimonetes bacterium]|nr:hypothetical protein [Candidatus Cloacimonadota bacterium]